MTHKVCVFFFLVPTSCFCCALAGSGLTHHFPPRQIYLSSIPWPLSLKISIGQESDATPHAMADLIRSDRFQPSRGCIRQPSQRLHSATKQVKHIHYLDRWFSIYATCAACKSLTVCIDFEVCISVQPYIQVPIFEIEYRCSQSVAALKQTDRLA